MGGMAHTINNKPLHAEALKKTKVETTYEYVPIIGQILGFWRKQSAWRAGTDAELHIAASLNEFDRLFINGKEVRIECACGHE